jgi:tRNA(Ile)-lysidine synthase
VAALAGAEAATCGRFGIAVSGGVDSLALLLLSHAAFPGRIAAATVDHELRQASAAEARQVADLCARLDIPHATLRPPVPITGNLQSAARAARYGLLEAWRMDLQLDWVMTAHHADDQLETLVMRVNRSSGVGGMAGIRSRQGHVLRPLLDWRRAELEALISQLGLEAVDDPSNHDARFDRARIRPLVQSCNLIDATAANAVARNLAEADSALDWTVEQIGHQRLEQTAAGLVMNVGDLPAELLRRLLLRALRQITGDSFTPRGQQLTATIQALARGEQAMLGTVLIKPEKGDRQRWLMRPAPAARGQVNGVSR